MIAIPARLESTRLPRKALKIVEYVNNQPISMIHKVWMQAKKSKLAKRVIVCTDHESIQHHVNNFGGECVMTSNLHRSGTDRIVEMLGIVGESCKDQVVVNLQGDEPLINPEYIDLAIESLIQKRLLDKQIVASTLATPIRSRVEAFDQNAVKVVMEKKTSKHQLAMYFSRSLIPCYVENKTEFDEYLKLAQPLRHIGLYAYNRQFLEETFQQLSPSTLENVESLEQLRIIESGYRITVNVVPYQNRGVDTEEDLAYIQRILGSVRSFSTVSFSGK